MTSMLTASITALLVATSGGQHQDATQQAMQRDVALDAAKRITLGSAPEQVATETRRVGVASTSYFRCAAGLPCSAALDRRAATKRVDKWIVSDQTLVVVFCGSFQGWRAAAVDLSTLDRPDPFSRDPGAVHHRKDDELARSCTLGDAAPAAAKPPESAPPAGDGGSSP
jgi:hypothetical protein